MEVNYKNEEGREQDWTKRNEIINKITIRGYGLKGEAEFLDKFDREMRVCNTCGKTFKEAEIWRPLKIDDRYGEELIAGLVPDCFNCETLQIIKEGQKGL